MKSDVKDAACPATPLKPLAIIGLGCLFPKADNLEAYWANIRDRVDCITDIPPTHWNPDDYYDTDKKARDKVYARKGGFLNALAVDPMEVGVAPRDIEATDTTQLMGLLAVKQALADAGYGPDKDFDREHTSVILGVTGALEMVIPLGARLGHPIWRKALEEAGVDPSTADDVVQRISGSYVEWQENSFPGLLGNVTAGRIANRFDLGGTNCVVDAACASSLGALHLAAMELSSGRSNMVITGGADTFNDIFMYTCFSKTPAISPTGHARPFDAEGDGTILGEGLGIVVIKRLEDAEAHGDRIYAVVRGIGSSSDGKGNAVYAPSAGGQVKALRRAYQQSGVGPETIELIEAHGTGTVVGDGIELKALLEVYGDVNRSRPWCALGSVKSQIGHTKAAAGSSGLIKTALALKNKTLPPTIKVKRPLGPLQEDDSPFYLNAHARPWMPNHHPRRAALSSFGFGGSNFHLVIEEYGSDKKEIDWDGRTQIVAFSGNDPSEIARQIDGLPEDDWAALRGFAHESRTAYHAQAPCRLLLAVERDRTDLSKLKQSCRTRLQTSDPGWSLPDGAWFGSGDRPGKLALLFPGQGSQYAGMFRDIACRFPQMFDVLADANHAFSGTDGEGVSMSLCDHIYPVHDITEEDLNRAEDALKDTRVAQPAIGAVALGLYRVLEYFGLEGDLAAGHSYGELVALCASGRYDESDLHRLSGVRGKLMARTNGRQGSMLAVRTDAEKARSLIESHDLGDLVVANKNAPQQTVISGGLEEIEKAAGIFNDAGIPNVHLKVSNAFHSHLMTSAKGPFEDALEGVTFASAHMPVYANSTAAPYPAAEGESREILAGQLVQPVEFIDQIVNMYQTGVGTFLEVGPGKSLTGLVGAILKGKKFNAVPVDGSKGARSSVVDLARTLAHLSALGYALDLTKWDGAYIETGLGSSASKFTVSICGANQFLKKECPPVAKPASPAAPCPDKTAANLKINQACAPPNMDRPVSNVNRTIQEKIVKKEIEPPPSPSSPEPVDGGALRDALRLTQDNIQTLQWMQTQTADLHRQFLSGQETAQQGLLDLIRQQQYLLEKTFGNGRVEFRPSAAPVRVTEPTPPVEAEKAIPMPKPVPRTAAPAAPPEPAPEPQVEIASDSARIMAVLIEVVSANTGYPTEMLDPDMSLDADLGIDSIKRVEILSTLSERLPDIPAAGPDEVGKLSTLREVVDFLAGRSEAAPVPDQPGDASPVSGQDQVIPALLKAVSDHTGYPVEMLELDMKLDADLGIDSIKRVEILSALAETMPDLPVVEPDQVGRLQTLREVADFLSVEKKKTEPDPIEASRLVEPTVSADSPVDASVWETVCRVVEDLAGYDAHNLDQRMRLEEDLGFDPVSLVTLSETVGKRLNVDPEQLRVPLETLGCLARHFSIRKPLLDDDPGRDAAPNPLSSIDRYVVEARCLTDDESEAPNPPQGSTIWVIADNSGFSQALVREINEKGGRAERISWTDGLETPLPSDLAGLILIAPDDTHDDIMAAAFGLAKRAASALRQPSGTEPAIFATVSRLDGRFGLGGPKSDFNPVSGGLAGLAKTIHHEWPEVTAKAFDLDISESDFDGVARSMVAELTRPGPVEVGLADGRKWTLQIRPEPLAVVEDALHLNRDDVVLVSGGARGVTAEAALALARKWRPTLVLFGRTPLPDEEPEELAGLTGEAAIKKELFRQAPPGTTPAQVEQSYKRLVSAREVRENLKRLRETGSRAVYLSVDVTDRESVEAAVYVVRQDYGPIKGLVHGAGVLADRLIEDKTADQFTRVYNTKATGLATLLEALRKDPLQLMVLFSSSTGRFGRTGQVDYAMANEVLNKTAQKEAASRLGCRVVSFNWGPWAGGMVNPSLEKIFQSEGLATIPLEAGAEYMVREIASGPGGPVEIVILGAGSRLPEEVLAADPRISDERTIIERHLSIDQAPILRSHVIDGQAALPMALMIEWMARVGTGDNPEDSYVGFDGLEVHRRLTLEESVDLILTAEPGEDQGRTRTRRVRLEARRGSEGVSHAESHVVLSRDYDLGRAVLPEIPKNDYPHNGRFYEEGRLFHGPDLRGVVHIDGCGKSGIRGRIKTSPPASDWFPETSESAWLTDPLALDSVFQMVILWCWEEHGLPALPVRIGRYRRSGTGYPADTDLLAQVSIKKGDGPMIEADVEITDTEGRLLARLEDLVCFESESLVEPYRRNRLEPLMPKAAGSVSPKSGQLWPNDL